MTILMVSVATRAGNFHGEKRSNKTHASRTDPEALLASKGQGMGARPSYTGHTLMENRNGLLVNADLTLATGTAERDAAIDMAAVLKSGATLGADKGYDTREFVDVLRFLDVTPHVAQNLKRAGGSAVDGRTTPSCGLRNQPAGAQTSGGTFWLGQTDRRAQADKVQRSDSGKTGLPEGDGCLQSHTYQKSAARGGVVRGYGESIAPMSGLWRR